MDLTELRTQIDEVDSQIVSLFQKRMELVDGVAAVSYTHLDVYKRQSLRCTTIPPKPFPTGPRA